MRNDIGSRVCSRPGRPPLGRPRRPSWCPSPAGPRHDRHAAWFSSSAGFLRQAGIQSVRTAETAVRKERYSLWFCAIIVFASPRENILTFSAISREYAFMIFVESLKCLTKRKNGSSDWTEKQEKQRHRASRRRGSAACSGGGKRRPPVFLGRPPTAEPGGSRVPMWPPMPALSPAHGHAGLVITGQTHSTGVPKKRPNEDGPTSYRDPPA